MPPPIANKGHLMGSSAGIIGESTMYNSSGKVSEKTDILSQKSQTQKVEGIYSKINGSSNTQGANDNTLRLDQIK
jgi:hypothetical protein